MPLPLPPGPALPPLTRRLFPRANRSARRSVPAGRGGPSVTRNRPASRRPKSWLLPDRRRRPPLLRLLRLPLCHHRKRRRRRSAWQLRPPRCHPQPRFLLSQREVLPPSPSHLSSQRRRPPRARCLPRSSLRACPLRASTWRASPTRARGRVWLLRLLRHPRRVHRQLSSQWRRLLPLLQRPCPLRRPRLRQRPNGLRLPMPSPISRVRALMCVLPPGRSMCGALLPRVSAPRRRSPPSGQGRRRRATPAGSGSRWRRGATRVRLPSIGAV